MRTNMPKKEDIYSKMSIYKTSNSDTIDCHFATGHDLLKNALLKISLQHNGHLHDNCLIYILTIYCELLHFQLFCQMHTYAYSHRNSRSKCTHKSPKKQSYFAKKCFF